MNFDETPVQRELRELTRRFAQKEIAPIVDEDESQGRFRPEIIQKLGDLGLTGVPVPEIYGGAGLGYQEYAIVIEELARVSASYAISVAVTGLPQMILAAAGTEEQKKKYIPPLATGRAIGAFSLSEASSGSDAGSLRASAQLVKSGDGDRYVINGTKLWCTQADDADTLVLMARTGGPGSKGVSSFIIEKGMKGFSMGKREKKMGCHISHTMELVFQDCEVPVANRIGPEGQGIKVALSALNGGRITIAAVALGLASHSYEVAAGHATVREQFGKPIVEHQGVSFILADMAVALASSKLLIQRAAWLKDQGRYFATEAAMAKLFSTDSAMKITTDAVQILGGAGYTTDFPVERHMREAKVLQIVEGTNQVQRIVICRALSAEAGSARYTSEERFIP